jgi:cell wall-associated NlpC family hydrolase
MAYRSRRRGGRLVSPRFAGSAAAAGLLAAALHGHHAGKVSSRAQDHAASRVLAYARGQLGKPYLWGGTGPGAFDCSGLTYMAYRSAGIHIARTSQDQWATEPHVSSPQPGDLVFYPGADGTWASPGHVAIVVAPGQMIEAYGTGYPIRQVPIRPGMVGYTDPAAGA